MTYDEATEAARQAHEALIASIADPKFRDFVETEAFSNSFAVEVHAEYENDQERWEVAKSTAEMIIDDPAGFGWPN